MTTRSARGGLLRTVSLDDAATYSPWPRRLSGQEAWERPPRDPGTVQREYNDGWFRHCLELWIEYERTLPPSGPGSGEVLRFFHRLDQALMSDMKAQPSIYPAGELLCSMEDQLLAADLILATMLSRDFIVRYVDRMREFRPASTAVEMGCGTGVHLFHLFSFLQLDRIVGGEVSSNAVSMARAIATRFGIPGTFKGFDFADPGALSELTAGLDDYFLMTSHAIEQVDPSLTERIVDGILALPNPPAFVVNFEPMAAADDAELGVLAREYARKNHYNDTLLAVVQRYERAGRVAIVDYHKRFFGVNAFHPLSMLCWHAR